jgi:hypothetical protein
MDGATDGRIDGATDGFFVDGATDGFDVGILTGDDVTDDKELHWQ